MDASVSVKTTETAEMDEARHRGPTKLRRLLSPGLSERLADRSTDAWSSSEAIVRGLRSVAGPNCCK
jgi:hypothetical protein